MFVRLRDTPNRAYCEVRVGQLLCVRCGDDLLFHETTEKNRMLKFLSQRVSVVIRLNIKGTESNAHVTVLVRLRGVRVYLGVQMWRRCDDSSPCDNG